LFFFIPTHYITTKLKRKKNQQSANGGFALGFLPPEKKNWMDTVHVEKVKEKMYMISTLLLSKNDE
jgi:hypothetical protein